MIADRPAHRRVDGSALAEVENDLTAERQRLGALNQRSGRRDIADAYAEVSAAGLDLS